MGKSELVAAALERLADDVTGLVARSRADTPAGVVDGFVALWRELLRRSDFADGCGVAAVATGVGAGDDPLLDTAAATFGAWRLGLADRLVASGMTAADADRVAVVVIAALEGAVVVARAERDLDGFEVVAEHLHHLVAD